MVMEPCLITSLEQSLARTSFRKLGRTASSCPGVAATHSEEVVSGGPGEAVTPVVQVHTVEGRLHGEGGPIYRVLTDLFVWEKYKVKINMIRPSYNNAT